MLYIDNKISPLPVWRYASKPICYFTFAQLQQTTADSNKVSHQHLLAIKVPNFSKIYRSKQQPQRLLWGHPKTLQFQVFVITLDTKTWDWSVLGWPHKSRYSRCLFQ